MEIGQIIKYRDIVKNKMITGKIVCIVQILDSVNKSVVDKKFCYIQENKTDIAVMVSEEDIIHEGSE